jgi:hypothetical protein
VHEDVSEAEREREREKRVQNKRGVREFVRERGNLFPKIPEPETLRESAP